MNKSRLYLFYLIIFSVYLIGGFSAIIFSYVYNFNRESVGFVILFCPLIALFISRKEPTIPKINFKPHIFKILSIMFIITTFIALLISLNSQKMYYLPLEFFIVISIIASVIVIQITSFSKLTKNQVYSILLEIFIFSTLISYTFLFLFAGPYGNDSSYHLAFIKNILTAGNINYWGNYSNYPIFHLLFASLIFITGITSFKIIQLILAITQILFFIFLFILCNKLFNEKVALLSVLLISIIPYIIVPHYSYYPTAFDLTIFLMALYLFLDLFKGSKVVILFLLSFVTLIFSHPLGPLFFIIISLLLITTSKSFKGTKSYISITGICLMIVMMLAWWMKPTIFQDDLLSIFILSIKNALITVDYTNVGRATLSQFYSFKDIFLFDLGFVMLIGFSIFGSFYGVKKFLKMEVGSKIDERIIIFIITLILIPIPYVMAIVYPQSLPDRWFPFISIFLSISAGFGIYILFKKSLTSKIKHFFLIFIVITTVFFSVTSPIANPNSHIYSEQLSGRSALTYSELSATEFMSLNGPINNTKCNSIFLASSNEKHINPLEYKTYSKGLLVIRDYDLNRGFTIPLFGAKGLLLEVITPNKKFLNFLNNSNQVYNNGNLKMYYN